MRHERGNILFLILLAVILFAALSYAVTNSLRGGGKDASEEKYDAMAAQLIQYGTLLENTMIRSRLANNIADWAWDFDDGTGPSASSANNTCTQTACRLFTTSARQGLTESLTFDNNFIDPRISTTASAAIYMRSNHVMNAGTSEPDLILFIPNLKPEVCKAINKILHGVYDNVHEGYSLTTLTGTLTSFPVPSIVPINDQAPYLANARSGCAGREGDVPANGGTYFHVLIAR